MRHLTFFLLDYPTWSDAPSTTTFASFEIKTAVDLCVFSKPAEMAEHGHIRQWDARLVASWCLLLYEIGPFNNGMFLWEALSVVDVSDMFCYADFFNLDLSRWSIGQDADVSCALHSATSFGQKPVGNSVERLATLVVQVTLLRSQQSFCLKEAVLWSV